MNAEGRIKAVLYSIVMKKDDLTIDFNQMSIHWLTDQLVEPFKQAEQEAHLLGMNLGQENLKEAERHAFEEGQREMRERALSKVKETGSLCYCADKIEVAIRALPFTPRNGKDK